MSLKNRLLIYSLTLIGILDLSSYGLPQFYIFIKDWGLRYPIPAFYLFSSSVFAFLGYRLLPGKRLSNLFKIIAFSILYALFFYLVEMNYGFARNNPFAKSGNIYAACAKIYFILGAICLGIFSGGLLRKWKELSEFLIPVSVLLAYALIRMFIANQWLEFSALFVSFLGFFKYNCLKYVYYVLKSGVRLIESNKKAEFIFMAVIFSFSFLLRYFWAHRIISLTGLDFLKASDDGLTYNAFGIDIAKGKYIVDYYWGGYGYWFFIGLIYKVFGINNFNVLTLFQSLINATVPVFAYLIGKSCFDARVGILSAILTSLNMLIISLSVYIGMEALFIPMLMFSMFFLIKAILDNSILRYRHIFLAGFLFGLTNLFRQEVIFMPFLIGLLIIFYYKRKISRLRLSTAVVCLIIGSLIPLVFQSTMNFLHGGQFKFSSSQAAVSFSLGCGSEESAILSKMGFNPFSNIIGCVRVFSQQALKIIELFSLSMLKKGSRYLFFQDFGMFDPLFILNTGAAGAPYYRFPVAVAGLGIVFMIIGAIVTAIKRPFRLERAVLFTYVFYTISLYAAILATNSRHRGVLIPFFFISLSVGLVSFWDILSNKAGAKNK